MDDLGGTTPPRNTVSNARPPNDTRTTIVELTSSSRPDVGHQGLGATRPVYRADQELDYLRKVTKTDEV